MINVALTHEIAGQLVIGGEGAVDGVVGIDERDEGGEVAFGAAFTKKDVQAET